MATSGCQQRSRKRKLVLQEQPQELTEYEKQRIKRIERNRQALQELEVIEASKALQQSLNKPKKQPVSKPKQPVIEGPPAPSRRSSRIAGHASGTPAAEAAALIDSDKPDASTLLTQAEYFKRLGKELTGFESDGRYRGWVNPEICKMYGIASSASEAWEAEGGGAYSRHPDMSQVPAHLRAKGWSDAKAFAATQLRKNPNTYFYRHVAPHEQQAQGEWTEEEHQLFLQTAKQHGVGDKWGLFSSHIPQRVGYQCSAYYRDVIIAQGLVIDRRYKFTPSGHVVYVG